MNDCPDSDRPPGLPASSRAAWMRPPLHGSTQRLEAAYDDWQFATAMRRMGFLQPAIDAIRARAERVIESYETAN